MKKYLLYFLLFIPIIAQSQNLVPNPGFESTGTVICGWVSAQYIFDNSVTDWNDPTNGTPDILSTLISPSCSNYQPHSTFSQPDGYQSPHSGNIFAGFITYYEAFEYREYIQNQLTATMVPGKTYVVSLYISHAGESQFATNNIGAFFSTAPTDSLIYSQLGYTPQVNFSNTMTDTTDWVLLSDTIVATDAWQYIIIGNLYSDLGTTIINANPAGYHNYAYYYIDDISVTEVIAVAPPTAALQASDTIICANDCISFTDHSVNATSWMWTFTGGTPATSTDQNPSVVCYFNAGIFNVKLVATNGGGSDSITAVNYINAAASPPIPNITQYGDTLKCSADTSYISYQWFDSTNIVNGATNSFFIAPHNGNFNVQVENKNDCKVAVGINVVLNGVFNEEVFRGISIFPNPADNELFISQNIITGKSTLAIYNVLGELCNQSEIENAKSEIDISMFPSGVYFIKIQGMNAGKLISWTGRFIKE